jgi:hypothetical protein
MGLALLVPVPAVGQTTDVRVLYDAPKSEVGHDAIDQSTNGNDGHLRGGVTRVHGVYQFHRLALDHKYDRIRAANSVSLNPGLSMFTYSVRLKVEPNAAWRHTEMAVIRHGDSDVAGGDYKMELRKTPAGIVTAFCVIHDDDEVGVGYVRGRGGLKTIADGNWHTIACSRVAVDMVALTIDGHTVQRPTTGDLGNVEGNVPLLIGCQMTGDGVHMREQFVGQMDDITVTVQ